MINLQLEKSNHDIEKQWYNTNIQMNFIKLTLTLLLLCHSAFPCRSKENVIGKIDNLNKQLENFSHLSIDSFFLLANQALDLSKDARYEEGEAKSDNNLGVYFILKGQYKVAYYYLSEALIRFKKLKNENEIARCMNNLGLVYLKQGEYQQAEELFYESIRIKRSNKDTSSIKQTMFNLAQVYQSIGNFKKAYEILELTSKNELKAKDYKDLVITLIAMGDLSDASMERKKALSHFYEAKKYASLNAYNEIPGIMMKIANIHYALNNIDSAYNHAAEAYWLSDSLENKDVLKESTFLLSLIFEKKQKINQALEYLKQYNILRNLEASEQVSLIDDEHNFTTQILENKTNLLQEKLSKKQLTIILLSIVLAFVFIVSILVFGLYRARNRYNKIIQLREADKLRYELLNEGQEKERIRLARELHDGLGQLLSTLKLTLTELQDSINFNNKSDAELMANSIVVIDEACAEVRNVSHDLMPNALIRKGLASAIKDMADKINKSQKIKVSSFIDILDQRFQEKVEIAIYRILQEITNNVIKHSCAENLKIYLFKNDNIITLTTIDDGIGIKNTDFERSSGIGWENIQSRLTMINGTITILPNPEGKGTKMVMEINLNE